MPRAKSYPRTVASILQYHFSRKTEQTNLIVILQKAAHAKIGEERNGPLGKFLGIFKIIFPWNTLLFDRELLHRTPDDLITSISYYIIQILVYFVYFNLTVVCF